ncbi:MAG: virulence RhuM family protein [Kiritimatiellae bacterium]|nr:virulence RhuM family protein [Kiritimatiellia bacterium]
MKNDSEIVIYQNSDGGISLDVRLEDETVWLTQAHMALLFGKAKSTINEHIKNVFDEGELAKTEVMQKFGNSEFQQKSPYYYNLDVIISVGYRVRSQQGTQFRIWATQRLKDYIIKGFALNDDRFKSGDSMNYFSELQDRIREIRLSERFFYQKIKDIYTTSVDYNAQDEQTVLFFKMIQNKLLWAISEQTAAELIYRRVDAKLPLMGMQSLDRKSSFALRKSDVSIAKNYLQEDEIKLLGLLVEQYLAFAETMAHQQTPMYMKNWIERLDAIIQLNGKELLTHAGKISHEVASDKSALEYGKYKEQQRQLNHVESMKELERDLKGLNSDGAG